MSRLGETYPASQRRAAHFNDLAPRERSIAKAPASRCHASGRPIGPPTTTGRSPLCCRRICATSC
eukprot:10837496-Lingulodinium_polyedra.AAC.1